MAPENTNKTICPTCGSPVKPNATRCLVCGTAVQQTQAPGKADQTATTINAPKMPEITLNLPLALGIMVILLAIGAGVVYALTANMMESAGTSLMPSPTASETMTPTHTLTPTATETGTPMPTATLLPPIAYTVQDGDLCSGLAAYYDVSVKSIIDLNKLSPECILSIGMNLQIPQPTITNTPLPTNALSFSEATEAACQTLSYTVAEYDTLAGIAANYNISMESIKQYNNKTSETVFIGEKLTIPLCERLPTAGPTPTATNPPPYAASNLLLPANGEVFTSTTDSVTLQWASNVTLLQNESYKVVIEDLTEGQGKKLIDYATDTKFIVPASFRPVDSSPHIIRWFVEPVRQNGTMKDGSPIWESAGATSEYRVFSWYSETAVTAIPTTAVPTATPTEE